HQNQILTHNLNNISIQVNTPYFGNIQNLQYEYRVNKDVTWKKMTGDKLYLDALSPKSYQIQIRAHDVDQQLYGIPLICSFEILAPIYQRWWFIGLAIILTQAGFLLLYRYYSKRKHVMIDLQHQLALSKHETFSASINPHFIFNALNSVQHYINTNDRLNANRYLTGFAKLIRKNFNATKQLEITIAEEVENLQLYLNLERMRQQEAFSYQIDIDPELDAEEILIPVMIIQPFVENAIIHGFVGSEQAGFILISFKKANQSQCQISIQDNGVGIEGSHAKNTNTQHKSSGIAITEQRILLYGKIKKQAVSVTKKVAFPNSITNPGYLVKIILPLQV
ncbi:MAG: histidine kinase, partial [Chitinophagaceae bacterium]|nr:histidine kinase [Chitinophagaceae bacterium]